ncbi:MAG: DUF5675 family protein [Acidobacteriota bacterium]
MFLTSIRYSETEESTLDVLLIDGYFACHLLEPPYGRRIPGGIYDLGLQQIGNLHLTYKKKFPDSHRGMILVKNVPGRTGILFHIGNFVQDTDGCLLTGTTCNNNQLDPGRLFQSTDAFLRMSPVVTDAILDTEGAKLLIGTPQELIKFDPFNKYRGGNHV